MFVTPSKSSFETAVKERGFTVSVERENKGSWNECRNFVVNGKTVGVACKGERPDWAAMQRTVENMA